MAENKKLTYVDGSLWFNGQLVATVSDEWIRANIQTIKNILEVSSGGPAVASDVSYDNTISQIIATNVQAAIDEIHEEIDDRAGACEGRLDVVEDNIDRLVDTINMEVIPEELGATVGEAIVSVNDSLSTKADKADIVHNERVLSSYDTNNFHIKVNTVDKIVYCEVATQENINVTANAWTSSIIASNLAPLPSKNRYCKAPCAIIKSGTAYTGMIKINADGTMVVWSPSTLSSAQVVANFAYAID